MPLLGEYGLPVSDRESHRLLKVILAALLQIREELRPPPVPAALELVATLPNGTVLKGNKIMAVINDIQSVPLSLVKFVPDPTAGGKTIEAPVTGPVVWTNGDATVITLTPSADTFTAVAAAVGPDGTSTITAVADGLTATIDITVVDSEVASLTIVAGTPTP